MALEPTATLALALEPATLTATLKSKNELTTAPKIVALERTTVSSANCYSASVVQGGELTGAHFATQFTRHVPFPHELMPLASIICKLLASCII